MGKSLSFDIAALLILTLLLVSCIVRKMTSGTPNRLFLAFISFNLLATVFDIWAVALDNASSTNLFALHVTFEYFNVWILYLFIHNFTVPVYVLFVISLTDTWHKIRKSFWIQFVLWAPCSTVFAALLTNTLTGKMFLVEGGYQRGSWFFLIYAAVAVYLVFVVGYMLRYRRLVERSKIIAVMSYIPIGIVASRVGRRRTIMAGVVLLAACFMAGFLLTRHSHAITPLMYAAFALVGLAWAAINVNSLPMVVEMCRGSDVGKFTGYYYTASMAAQVITPVLAGTLMKHIGYQILFPYAAVFVALSFVTMCFVRHGDSKVEAKRGLAAFEDMDD